ncbi:MAG: hypothetical protein ACPF9L_04780 [Candidatus Poseidoniaceae archaeon]
MRILAVTLCLVMLASPVVGHELQIYTVIVNSEGGQPADIPNGTLKEGDSVWFWMKDTTENATLVIEIERDGATARSGDLVFECELDENGSKVNEDCNTRYDFVFNPQNSAGIWNFTFLTYVNDTLVKTSYGSVDIQVDMHDEMHNDSHDEIVENDSATTKESASDAKLSTKSKAGIMAVMSLFGILFVASQMGESTKSEEE